ncbi:MAG: hypothetical protein ACYS6K_05085 [Planctomycetota bacterium]
MITKTLYLRPVDASRILFQVGRDKMQTEDSLDGGSMLRSYRPERH